MPTTKTLQWPGSADAIRLTADRWQGSETVYIESPENFGGARNAKITFYSENSNRGATVDLSQAAYTVVATLSSLTFTSTETTAKQVEIVTNGSELKDVKVTLSGAGADKFTYTGPTLKSTTATESRYIIEVRPVGVNSTNDDYTAILSVKAGTINPVQISLTQSANATVSVNYSDFHIGIKDDFPRAIYYTVSVPTNPTGNLVRASGDTFALNIKSVYCTRTEMFADGSTKVTENYLYDASEWECRGQLGSPERASFAATTSNKVLSIVCKNLQNTPYSQTVVDSELEIWIRPAGTTYGFGPSQIIGGKIVGNPPELSYSIQDNESTVTGATAIQAYEEGRHDLEGDAVEVTDEITLPASSISGVNLFFKATGKRVWTSGYEEPDIAIEVQGQNTESGIPASLWLSGIRTWPYLHSKLGMCTRIALTFTTNTGAQRQVVGAWKTADAGATQSLQMVMGGPEASE